MGNLREILKLSEDPLGGAVEIGREMVGNVDGAVEERVSEGQGESYLSLLNPLVQGKDASESVLYAAAYLQARVGDEIVARQLFAHLCERLEQRKKWEGLSAVLERSLRLVGTPESARIAARLWEKGGSGHAPPDLLRTAHELNPDEHRILWALGISMIEAGDREGYEVIGRALPGYASKREVERVEEGVLHIIENPSADSLACCIEAFDRLVREGVDEAAVTLFELSMSALIEAGLAGETWTILRRALEKSAEREAYRKIAAAAGIAAYSSVRDPAKLFETAGIAKEGVPTEEALALLDKLLEMPPGRHVAHTGWGVGEIVENDGESLMIRFESKGAHKMSISLAKTALILLEPTDLRVKVYLDRAGMMEALKKNHADFLHHALEHLKGEAAQDEIKKLLVTLGILEPAKWADWWKKARKEAEQDERFDTSQIFRKVIRIRSEKNGLSTMPEVDLSGKLRKGLDLLFKYLEQHPTEGDRIARRYGDELRGISGEEERPPAERVQAHLLLHRVGAVVEDEFRRAIADWTERPDISPFSTEQQKILIGMAPPEEKHAVASHLLDSKVQAVRREAWTILMATDDRQREREITSILTASPARSNAVLHTVRQLAVSENHSIWPGIHALINIVEQPEKENYRKSALDMLRSDALQSAMSREAPPPEDENYLRNRLLNWKHSERYLFPILEAFEGSAVAEMATAVDEQRRALRPQAAAGVYDRFGGRVLMTRATLARLQKEAESLDWDLKTTIPREIRTAREHGDLRENAEYDAAKAKQADASKRLEEIYGRLRLAKVIEEVEVIEGEAGPGTEVDLVDDAGERVTYWVLGEGDGDLGDEVISYRAPLGGILLGKKVGEQVGPIGEKNYRIAAIRTRKPDTKE